MTINAHPIESPASHIKAALDHAELVERVPALQPSATQFETMDSPAGRTWRLNENGALILKFPRHHLVVAYSYELANANARREYVGDLRRARRRFKEATINYENRVNWRNVLDMNERFVCLSAIIEARAEAVYWRKIVKEAEHVEAIKRQNERALTRHRRNNLGLAY